MVFVTAHDDAVGTDRRLIVLAEVFYGAVVMQAADVQVRDVPTNAKATQDFQIFAVNFKVAGKSIQVFMIMGYEAGMWTK